MKFTLKTQYQLFWSAIGFGAMSVISAIIFLQLESMAGHDPVQYGTEPYAQNLELTQICMSQTQK